MVRSKGREAGSLVKVLTGTATAAIISLAGLAVLAHLTLSGTTGEKRMSILLPVLLFLATAAGSKVAAHKNDRGSLAALITSGAVILLMLIGGLAMDGAFENVLFHTGTVAGGGVLSCVLCRKIPAGRQRRKRSSR